MTPHEVKNPWEELARQSKASDLARYIRQHADDVDLSSEVAIEAIRNMPQEWWKDIARHAGVKPPTFRNGHSVTVDTVVEMLAADFAFEQVTDDDPFEGLGGGDDRRRPATAPPSEPAPRNQSPTFEMSEPEQGDLFQPSQVFQPHDGKARRNGSRAQKLGAKRARFTSGSHCFEILNLVARSRHGMTRKELSKRTGYTINDVTGRVDELRGGKDKHTHPDRALLRELEDMRDGGHILVATALGEQHLAAEIARKAS